MAVSDATGIPSAIIATTSAVVGDDATAPTVRITLPAGWQGGTVPGSWPADGVVRISHKGVTRSTRLVGAGDTTNFVFDQIGDFQWDDGFSIDFTPVSRLVYELVGDQVGSDADITFDARNPAPFNAGTHVGTNGGTEMAAETATGTGGSRVYQGRSKRVPCDSHDVPSSVAAIVDEGFNQIGIAYHVPQRLPTDPVYDFQQRYSLAYVINGDI